MVYKKRRQKYLHRLKLGFEKFKNDVRVKYRKNNNIYKKDKKTIDYPNFSNFPLYKYKQKSKLRQKPTYSETIKFLLEGKNFLGGETKLCDGKFIVPSVFSLSDNYIETTSFLKGLLILLDKQTKTEIEIDFLECNQIDVCASMCMDIILADFINYFNQSEKEGHKVKMKSIRAVNYNKENIAKILFSVGTYKNLKGISVDFPNLKPFPIIIGDKNNPKLSEKRDIDITKTIDYIIECLESVNRRLTDEAETKLYKAVGEIVINAEEHSDKKKRYIIGYFEKIENSDNNYGVLNLSILNFGRTFYETFKNSENIKVKEQMELLSKKYTKEGWFRKKKFEEETLWTLYALQDGVTSMKDWKRGNGAIRFIESFFDLKGDAQTDDLSKMVITSGNTQIIFDGKYKIIQQKRNDDIFKMITFNESGNIEDIPDGNYVKYQENYFPGTIISIKLKLDYENTEKLN